jgi:hypothetical protein
MMHIDKAQAQALAAFVSRIRPDWDHPGIVAAISRARNLGSAAAVGAALCRLAENLELRTPAILADPGHHWSGTTVASRQAPVMCTDHPAQPRGRCTECAAIAAATDHAKGAALVKRALSTAPRPPAPRTPEHFAPVHDLDDARRRADQEA